MHDDDRELTLAVARAMSFPRMIAALWGQAMAFQTAAMGLGILLPGKQHFAAPSYQIALEALPWWAWGVLFLTSGVAMGLAVWRQPTQALFAAVPAAVAYGFLAITLGRALFVLPTASAAAVVNYGGLAILTIFAGWVAAHVNKQWPR